MNDLIKFPEDGAGTPYANQDDPRCPPSTCGQAPSSSLFRQLSPEQKVYPLFQKYFLYDSQGNFDSPAAEAQFEEFVDDYYLPLNQALRTFVKTLRTPLPQALYLTGNMLAFFRGTLQFGNLKYDDLSAYETAIHRVMAKGKKYRTAGESLLIPLSWAKAEDWRGEFLG